MRMFKDDLFTNNNYYILKNGLSSIIEKLEESLSFYNNVTIVKNNKLVNIFENKIITLIDNIILKI